jgi:hypothetical protein
MKRLTTAAAWRFIGQQYEAARPPETGMCQMVMRLRKRGVLSPRQQEDMLDTIHELLREQNKVQVREQRKARELTLTQWVIFLPGWLSTDGIELRAMLAYMLAEQEEAKA